MFLGIRVDISLYKVVFECEISSIGSHVLPLGPQMIAQFAKTVELLGDVMSLEEVGLEV